MNELKLIILCGGSSSERDISLSTGMAIFNSLENICKVKLLDYKDDLESILPKLKSVDLVFNALHGGFGENGDIQAVFEENDIKYTGSNSYASRLAIDKNKTKQIAVNNHILTPKWNIFNYEKNISDINLLDLQFPIVIKPVNEGSTMGLSIIENLNEIEKSIKSAFRYSNTIMLEEFIPGREMTIGILGDECLPIVEVIPDHILYDYECKYTPGMSEFICPAELDLEIEQNMKRDALRLHNTLGCRHYSRVDFRLNKDGEHYMLEINTLPGMTSTSLLPKAANKKNISFQLLLKKIIMLAK